MTSTARIALPTLPLPFRFGYNLTRFALVRKGHSVADRAALLIAVETFFEAGPPVPYAAADCAELLRALPAAGYDPNECILSRARGPRRP